MFQFETTPTARKRGLGRGLTAALAALTFAAGIAVASSSSALTLTKLTINTGPTAYIQQTGVINEYAYSSPVVFDAFDVVAGDTPSFLAFCVDIYHNINMGLLGSPPGSGLVYEEVEHVDNFKPVSPTVLSDYKKKQIGGLVNLGAHLWLTGGTGATNITNLAAIQGAIWEIANTGVHVGGDMYAPGYSYAADSFAQLIDSYEVGVHHEYGSYYKVIAPVDGRTQSFAFAAVPEPASWGLMIVGFFGMGSMLRSRRRSLATA